MATASFFLFLKQQLAGVGDKTLNHIPNLKRLSPLAKSHVATFDLCSWQLNI
jgi:hypothetical protein